jgi:hypothetical protein
MWGWIAFLPSAFLAIWGVTKIGIPPEREWLAEGLALAAAATISTIVLWMMNSRSIAARRGEGLEIELIVRPLDALAKAAYLFPTIFGISALLNFLLYGHMEEWAKSLVHSGAFSYIWSLWETAYRKPKPETPE